MTCTASIFRPKVCDRLHGAYNSHSVISVQLLTPFVVLRTDMYKSYAAASGLINWSLEGSLSIFAFALLSLPSVVLCELTTLVPSRKRKDEISLWAVMSRSCPHILEGKTITIRIVVYPKGSKNGDS